MRLGLTAAIFPLECPGCGRPAEPVCATCAAQLRAPAPASPPAGIDAWVTAFAYEGVARELVARVKYRSMHAAVRWLADAVVAALLDADLGPFDVVTWVPTTRERRRARGFDQAELLARCVATRARRPARRRLVRGPGPPQTGRSARDRRAGPALDARGRVEARVLVVDDVVTTGATLMAAAVALRAAGASSVLAATAARTPDPSTRWRTRSTLGATGRSATARRVWT